MQSYGTIWVCQCCMLTYANGECCSELYYGQDPDHDPLSSIGSGFTVTTGMAFEEHSCGKELHAAYRASDGEPPLDVDMECDCETNTYSTSSCDGCGSWLHGERHAMTLWKD